jgi:GNAT superfamily N-acetyltransferase
MIRHAHEDDLPRSIEIGIEFIKSGYYSHLPIDVKIMHNHAARALNDENWLYLVDEIDGEQVGFFSAHIEQTMFGPGTIAYQDLMYVQPDYRRGKTAMKFLKAFEGWAREKGCMNLYFAPSVHVDERFDKLARRAGFEFIGPQYGKKL